MTHKWDGDDRDDAEGINHVNRSRAVRGRCHVACADLWENGKERDGVRKRVRKEDSSRGTAGQYVNKKTRTESCRFMSTAEVIGKV